MYTKQQKKVLTVDKKPDTGKKTEKYVADVKRKPVEKTVSTKPAEQPASGAATGTPQVTTFIDILLCVITEMAVNCMSSLCCFSYCI